MSLKPNDTIEFAGRSWLVQAVAIGADEAVATLTSGDEMTIATIDDILEHQERMAA